MLTYAQRVSYCQNPTAIALLKLMAEKKTNLAVSLDVTHKKDLLRFADLLGPDICLLKTHIDILEDFDHATAGELVQLARHHQFLLFEDRKFADIGHTVQLQYGKGLFKIADWANITNAHILPGPGIIEGLKKIGLPRGNALLLIAQMSSQGSLITDDYLQETVNLALAHSDFVIGFITQKQLMNDPRFIHMTPGVQLETQGDEWGQRYRTPEQAMSDGADVIIVGRGIYQAKDPIKAARHYREQGWKAYQNRVKP